MAGEILKYVNERLMGTWVVPVLGRKYLNSFTHWQNTVRKRVLMFIQGKLKTCTPIFYLQPTSFFF